MRVASLLTGRLTLSRIAANLLAGLLTLSMAAVAAGQDAPRVTVGMSGWTGFAPLSLAEKAGIFKKKRRRRYHQVHSPEGPTPGHRLR